MFYDAISVFSTFRRGRGFWVADDHEYNLVSEGISVSAALFRSRRGARRLLLELGSLSVLDAVRCCTARGSKLKLDVIGLGESRVAMRRRAFDPGCLELRRLPACIRVRDTQDRVGSEDFDGSRDRWERTKAELGPEFRPTTDHEMVLTNLR